MAKFLTHMHRLRFVVIISACLASGCGDSLPEDVHQRSRQMPQWFEDAKLGIFIHWGPASVPAFSAGKPLAPGELEEVLLHDGARQELPYAEWYLYSLVQPDSATARHHAANYGDAPYEDFGDTFERRVVANWNPDSWADLFQQMGARYVVLVTKHHDGYTLWPSTVTNPYEDAWGARTDMVGDLARAVRARGMRFGTYYSTGLDWSFQLVAEGELVRDVMLSAPSSQEYADYAYAHMRELTDRYLPDVLWADIGYPSRGRRSELFEYYFSKVPEGTVNDRWEAVDVLGQAARIPGVTALMKWLARTSIALGGDPLVDDPARIGYKTAEYDSLPGIAPFKWETTRGLGGSFAFNAAETATDMLTASELVTFVVDTVAKNGNVLINIGPDSHGNIPDIQREPLLGLGDWLKINGEAIYDTQPWRRFRNETGRELRYTQRGNALYAIVFGEVADSFSIEDPGIDWNELVVLGSQIKNVLRQDGQINISLHQPLVGPAAVVRFSR